MDIVSVLKTIRPDANWRINGPEYTNIDWLDDIETKPTLLECQECWVQIKPLIERENLSRSRRFAFEEHSDPLFLKVWRGEVSEQEWLDSVEMVRSMYPYPEDATEE